MDNGYNSFVLFFIAILSTVVLLNSFAVSKKIDKINDRLDRLEVVQTTEVEETVPEETVEVSKTETKDSKVEKTFEYHYTIDRDYKYLDKSNWRSSYIDEDDLVEYACPACGYQLYVFRSAGSAASACFRCVNCHYESFEVYINHCTDSRVAKERLIRLYEAGDLIEDKKYDY